MTRVAWSAGLIVCAFGLVARAEGMAFQTIQPGVEYGVVTLVERPETGDGRLHVVRIDPSVASLDLGLATETGALRTAAQWSDQKDFSVVINAGMFETNFRSNVGRLVHGTHVNQRSWKKSYQSVLAMDPSRENVAKVTMLDRDAPDFDEAVKPYQTVIQNLRLIKAPGKNLWKSNKRKWSEAFIALDATGRLLFCFTRTPFEMAELMDRVLASGLGIVRAMHVEGGPEASLTIRGKALKLDLAGSYETGFLPRDDNDRQWELPNVIGVRAAKESR
jgi:hypothetical protein